MTVALAGHLPEAWSASQHHVDHKETLCSSSASCSHLPLPPTPAMRPARRRQFHHVRTILQALVGRRRRVEIVRIDLKTDLLTRVMEEGRQHQPARLHCVNIRDMQSEEGSSQPKAQLPRNGVSFLRSMSTPLPTTWEEDQESSSGVEAERSSSVQSIAVRSQRRPFRFIRRLARQSVQAVGRRLSPQGQGTNDRTAFERVLNVITCVPFFLAGRSFQRGLLKECGYAHFGRALTATGAIASLYHASSGWMRVVLRKADYYSIAWSSGHMRAATLGGLPKAAASAMLAVVPFKPTAVIAVNFVAVEVHCAVMALSSSTSCGLLLPWLRHAVVSLSAIAAFGAEDSMSGTAWGPLAHGLWHCLAAASMLTTGPVILAIQTASGALMRK